MTNHTPGPWVMGGVSSLDEYTVGIWCADRALKQEKIAVVFGQDLGAPNAVLIAAAPELLEALKALVAGVERDDNPRDEGHFMDSDEMIRARAVIARIEGRR